VIDAMVTWPGCPFVRIWSAVAVQTKGFGLSLFPWREASIAVIRSGTLVKTPRRTALSVKLSNQRSIMFSHKLEVGVKWRWMRVLGEPRVRHPPSQPAYSGDALPPFCVDRYARADERSQRVRQDGVTSFLVVRPPLAQSPSLHGRNWRTVINSSRGHGGP
jgi:hypothetical protein